MEMKTKISAVFWLPRGRHILLGWINEYENLGVDVNMIIVLPKLKQNLLENIIFIKKSHFQNDLKFILLLFE